MGVIEQVAKARCPGCDGCVDSWVTNERQNLCQGTGLRWPTLSRECAHHHLHSGGDNKHSPCPDCGQNWSASGRIPDVTLEKLCTIVDTLKVDLYCDGWQSWIIIEDNDWTSNGYGIGDTPLEATCAALLASVV